MDGARTRGDSSCRVLGAPSRGAGESESAQADRDGEARSHETGAQVGPLARPDRAHLLPPPRAPATTGVHVGSTRPGVPALFRHGARVPRDSARAVAAWLDAGRRATCRHRAGEGAAGTKAA